MSGGNQLFDRVVEASGLNAMVAPFTLSRLLLRADAHPRTLTETDLARALPELDRGIRVYLDDEAARAAVERLRELAAPALS